MAKNELEWLVSQDLVPYAEAVAAMERRVESIRAGGTEQAWLLEHPPLYTAGTSAKDGDLLEAKFPVHRTGRGGQYTYHGPGQRVGYVMLDLKRRQAVPDIRDYVWRLEEWVIRALAEFGIAGERRAGRVGIWVGNAKIAALGVRVRHWVTYHGVSVNVDPDLSHFAGIVPCGISDAGVTSMRVVLGRDVAMGDVDAALRGTWAEVF